MAMAVEFSSGSRFKWGGEGAHELVLCLRRRGVAPGVIECSVGKAQLGLEGRDGAQGDATGHCGPADALECAGAQGRGKNDGAALQAKRRGVQARRWCSIARA